MKIFQRKVQKQILDKVKTDKIIIITGARQVGKTTLLKACLEHLETEGHETVYMTLEKITTLSLLNQDPANIFKLIGQHTKKIYVGIDEIQYLDNPSNFLKLLYDEYRSQIQLIVTGSSSFYIDHKFTDSLAGRKRLFEIYPLSFEEFLIFKEKNNLTEYLSLSTIPLLAKDEIMNLYHEYNIYGGYPDVVLASSLPDKIELLEIYINDYIKKDMLDSNIQYHDKYLYLMRILATQVGNTVNTNELANTLGINASTVQQYLYIMQKSFHIAFIRPYFTNLRTELTKMPKVYFFDNGLRNILVQNFEPYDFRTDKGQLLEQIVFRQFITKYSLDKIKYRRTIGQNEVDFVIDSKFAYECKSNIASYKINKYKQFVATYPNIILSAIDLEESLYLA